MRRGDTRRPGFAGLQLLVLATALALGTACFQVFEFSPGYWPWLAYFTAAAVLAIAAFGDPMPPFHESARRRTARHVAGGAALLFAALALIAIPIPGREIAAALATVAALVCFALARWTPLSADEVRALIGTGGADVALSRRATALRCALALAAIACAAAAVWVNDHDTRWGFTLWLLSLILYAAAFVRRRRVTTDPPDRRDESGPPLSAAAELAAFLAILTGAAFLRFLWIDRFPTLIEGDEGRQALSAEAMWSEGFPDVFDIGWNSFANLSYLVEWIGVLLFGKSNANFRLSAALIGTLSLIPLHLWARRWWGGAVAVIATLLLAINREHLAWSRWAFNNIHVVLLAGLLLATFARALRTRRAIDWVWVGYALGLGFYTYHAAKLHPVLIAIPALILALAIPGFARRYASGALVAAVAFVLCLGPHLATTARRWETLQRENNRFDVGRLVESWRAGDVIATRDYVSAHVGGCLTVFSHYWKTREALFAPVVAVPFWLGLCWMLWRWRDPRHLVALVWIGCILVIGGMVTSYPPWKPRLLGLLPAACVAAALVAARARALLWRVAGGRGDVLFLPLLAMWMSLALWHTLDTEFVYRPRGQRGEIMTSLGRAIEAMPLPGAAVLLGAEPRAVVNHATIAADPRRQLHGPVLDASSVPLLPSQSGTAVYLITRAQRSLVPLVRHYYPDARERTVQDQFDDTTLWSFTLDPVRLAAHRALRRGAPSAADAGRWRGSLYVGAPGSYSIRAAGRRLSLDEEDLGVAGRRWLAAGWHAIAIGAGDDDDAPPAVDWILPGASDWSRVPPESFSDHVEVHGLLGRYFAAVRDESGSQPIDAVPDLQRIETALSFDWVTDWEEAPPPPVAAASSTMEWVGQVAAGENGVTELRLTTSDPARLYLDGKQLVDASGGQPPQVVEVTAAARKRSTLLVRVTRSAPRPEPWRLILEWRQPGGGWSAFACYSPAAATPPE